MEVVKIPIYLRPFSLISEPAPPMTLYEVNGEYGGGKKETIQKTKIFTRKDFFWEKDKTATCFTSLFWKIHLLCTFCVHRARKHLLRIQPPRMIDLISYFFL